MGTLNIIDWCNENGNPPPNWSVQARSVFVRFLPAVLTDSTRATGEVTGEVRRLLFSINGEMKRKEIQHALNLKHEDHFREAYRLPALEAGFIEMTTPDKPRSSKQKYRSMEKGRKLLKG